MRDSSHLPPLLRVVHILGLLFPLSSLALWGFAWVTALLSSPQLSHRLPVIGTNLTMLGLACIGAVGTYRTRFLQPDRGPFPLRSWQSRMRVIALAAALFICSLVLAVIISPTAGAFFVIVYPISMLASVVIVAVFAINVVVTTGG